MAEITEKELVDKLFELTYNDEFNVFKVLSNAEHEIRHSSFLAWLLDPQENHHFGNKFAVKFFNAVKENNINSNSSRNEGIAEQNWEIGFSEENFSYKKDTYIDTEVPVGTEAYKKKKKAENSDDTGDKDQDTKKRIDIFIKGSGFTCTIENKTFSDEHDDQCAIYKAYVENEYKDCNNYFIYLGIKEPDEFYEEDDIKYREKLKVQEKIKNAEKKLTAEKNVLDELNNNPENNKRKIEKTEKTIKRLISEINKLTKLTNPYKGYTFISYEQVNKILDELIKDVPEGSRVKELVKQYQAGLDEFYGRFDEETVACCNKIMRDNELAETIWEYKGKLKPKLRKGREVFLNYVLHIQDLNDKLIHHELERLIKKDYHKSLIDYHAGNASKKDPWAWMLVFTKNEEQKNKDIYEKITDIKKCLNEIDFFAKRGIFGVLFKYGSTVRLSQKCFNYILNEKNTDAFCSRLQSLLNDKEGKWEINLEYAIRNGGGYKINISLPNKIKIASGDAAKEIFGKIRAYKAYGIGQIKKSELTKDEGSAPNEDNEVLQMINEMIPEMYEGFKEFIMKYFTTEKVETDKKTGKKTTTTNQALNLNWVLEVTHKYNTEPIISDKDRNAIAPTLGKKYRTTLKKGLDMFEFTDDFMNTVCNSQE